MTDAKLAFTPGRSDVWSALVRRVHQPKAFVAGLTDFRILRATPSSIERELQFGQTCIRDTASFDETAGWIRFEVNQTADYAGGVLTITIVESGSDIALRFAYATTFQGADTEGINPQEYVKAAYEAADRDTVATVRKFLGYPS